MLYEIYFTKHYHLFFKVNNFHYEPESAFLYYFRDLYSIRHTLDLKTASVIANSLVYSKLDYCNTLYLNLPEKNLVSSYWKIPCSCSNPQNWTYHPCTQIFALAQNRTENPLQNHLSYLRPSSYLATSIPQKTYQNIKQTGFTRTSNHFNPLRPFSSSLKISNRSYNQTAPILWNNWPKSMRSFSNTSPNSATSSKCSSWPLSPSKTQFRSRLNIYLSSSHTHLNLLFCSDWPHRSLS